MHAVTKLLVVGSTLLSVALAALSIAFSTNADRIRNEYQRVVQESESRIRAAETSSLETQAQLDNALSETTRLELEMNSINETLRLVEADNESLVNEIQLERATAQKVAARIDQIAAMAETQASLIRAMYDEVASLRDNELRYAQKEIQLTDAINDLTVQLEVAVETNRALQEQLVEFQTTRTATAGAGGFDRASSNRSALTARITNVRRDPASNSLLAEIDAGTADSVREGMKLTIVHEGRFAGSLTITNASLNEAVGTIDSFNQNLPIQAGDRVVSPNR